MARSCSGNLRLYGTIPPHGLPMVYLEGGTLGRGAFVPKKSSIQNRHSGSQPQSQTGKADTNYKCINYEFLGSRIALELFHIVAKFCAGPCGPSRDCRLPIRNAWKECHNGVKARRPRRI